MQTKRPELTGNGLSQSAINEAGRRFNLINHDRMIRLRMALLPQQRVVLDLIPLLFHVNYPQLPGWISDDVPHQIQNYRPSRESLLQVKKLAYSFTYSHRMQHVSAIESIYVMGSVGTVAQSVSSDLDVWLCFNSSLLPEQIYLLEQKAQMISAWAQEFNLEMHFFLMNAQRFRSGETGLVTGESSGSAQHHLLLDEFYRANVLLAGSIPAWWLVPPEEEVNYEQFVSQAEEKHLIHSDSSIDFGGLPTIPGGEFVGAGMWQLYKGIESPYKSLMKLMLMEVYAQQYPDIRCLSLDFKQEVYKGTLDLNKLDPYIMLYRRLESYLIEQDEPERLELLRKAFYFKVGIPLSKSSKARGSSWRRELMGELVDNWGWSEEQLQRLDGRQTWTFAESMEERKSLVVELTSSYRFLSQVARQMPDEQTINPKDMVLLGRRLSAAFDRKPGKVVMPYASLNTDLSQEKLRLIQFETGQSGRSIWAAEILNRHAIAVHSLENDKKTTGNKLDNDNEQNLVMKAPSIVELLAWAYYNHLLDAHLNIPFIPLAKDRRMTLTDFELKEIISSFRSDWPLPLPKINQNQYFRPSKPVQMAVYANVGLDPLPHLSAKGLQKLSNRNDALDYSAMRENLVQSLDLVMLNTWNEVIVHRFEAADQTIVQCLQFVLSQLAKGSDSDLKLAVYCYSNTRPGAIVHRVKDLFSSAMARLIPQGQPITARYILSIANRFYVMQYQEATLVMKALKTTGELLAFLETEQSVYSPIYLDPWALRDKPELRMILSNAYRPGVQVYFTRIDARHVRIYLIDEMGSIVHYVSPFFDTHSLLVPLYRFLRMVEYRQNSERFVDEELSNQLNRKMRFYEFVPASRNASESKLFPRTPDVQAVSSKFHHVQVAVTTDFDGKIHYNLHCQNMEFDTLTLGDDFYHQVAAYLISLRRSSERYPCYITELELAEEIKADLPGGRAQTMHYFRYKQQLEFQINQALKLIP